MEEKSLKERIRLFMLRGWRNDPERWCNGGVIERLALAAGHKASTASRRARELAEAGILERKEERNPNTGVNSVWYRYIPTREQLLSRELQHEKRL